MYGVRFRVQGAVFRIQGSGSRVQGSGFRVQGAGLRMLTADTTTKYVVPTTSVMPSVVNVNTCRVKSRVRTLLS